MCLTHYFPFGNYDLATHPGYHRAHRASLENPFTFFTNTRHLLQRYHLSYSTKKDCIFPCNTAVNIEVPPRLPVRHIFWKWRRQLAFSRRQPLVATIHARVFEDNNGAYLLATNQRITRCTKYYLVKWHFFWNAVRFSRLIRCLRKRIISRKDLLVKPLNGSERLTKDGKLQTSQVVLLDLLLGIVWLLLFVIF
jgi:hypothetical protein